MELRLTEQEALTLFSLTLTDLELSERRRYRGMILTKWKMML